MLDAILLFKSKTYFSKQKSRKRIFNDSDHIENNACNIQYPCLIHFFRQTARCIENPWNFGWLSKLITLDCPAMRRDQIFSVASGLWQEEKITHRGRQMKSAFQMYRSSLISNLNPIKSVYS